MCVGTGETQTAGLLPYGSLWGTLRTQFGNSCCSLKITGLGVRPVPPPRHISNCITLAIRSFSCSEPQSLHTQNGGDDMDGCEDQGMKVAGTWQPCQLLLLLDSVL